MSEDMKQVNDLNIKKTRNKRPKDDILDIVKQFISYFEETDRSEKNDNRI